MYSPAFLADASAPNQSPSLEPLRSEPVTPEDYNVYEERGPASAPRPHKANPARYQGEKARRSCVGRESKDCPSRYFCCGHLWPTTPGKEISAALDSLTLAELEHGGSRKPKAAGTALAEQVRDRWATQPKCAHLVRVGVSSRQPFVMALETTMGDTGTRVTREGRGARIATPQPPVLSASSTHNNEGGLSAKTRRRDRWTGATRRARGYLMRPASPFEPWSKVKS